jgi:hypothetical protein
MINCFYNISAIFENPGEMGYLFRASGYRRTLESLDADKRRYGGDARWEDYFLQRRKLIDFDMRTNGFTKCRSGDKALAPGKGAPPAPHQQFLREFTYGWQEYSAISHATFQGLLPIALFLAPKDLPHEDRVKIEPASEQTIAIL